MVEFNQVVDGLLKYANKNIFPNMIPEQAAALSQEQAQQYNDRLSKVTE